MMSQETNTPANNGRGVLYTVQPPEIMTRTEIARELGVPYSKITTVVHKHPELFPATDGGQYDKKLLPKFKAMVEAITTGRDLLLPLWRFS